MNERNAPWHAHIYFEDHERAKAVALGEELTTTPGVLFVGALTDGPAGPHPIPQFEVHFRARDHQSVLGPIRASGLRTLIHPLTDDDLADHTQLAQWIGAPVPLDLSTLDPPGENKGVARFGVSDF